MASNLTVLEGNHLFFLFFFNLRVNVILMGAKNLWPITLGLGVVVVSEEFERIMKA